MSDRAERRVVFVIDVEPDGHARVQNDRWQGAGVSFQELSALRERIETVSQSPARFNWFFRLDTQMEQTWGRTNWLQTYWPELLPWVAKHGDLTGIHTHFLRWNQSRNRWFNDFADEAWCAECLAGAIEGYRSLFGVRPIASRFGDRWLSQDLVSRMKAEGIRYDITVEPGRPSYRLIYDPLATAVLPDYRRAQRTPYTPSAEDFLVPDHRSTGTASPEPLFLIPVNTTQPPAWGLVRRFPYLIQYSRPFNLAENPRTLWPHLAAEIERESAEPLVMALRSGDLGNLHYLRNYRYVTSRLAAHRGLKSCRFTGVDEAMECFLRERRTAA